MSLADISASFLAFGLLHLRGVEGRAGWRWLFLLEVCSALTVVRKEKMLTVIKGLLTLLLGVLAFGLMPAAPTKTASWFRGRKGWFLPR
jgi:hypothetical protein